MLHSPNLTAASSLDPPATGMARQDLCHQNTPIPRIFPPSFEPVSPILQPNSDVFFKKIKYRLIYKTNIPSILDTIALANIAILLPSLE